MARLIDADKLFPYGSVPFVQDDGFLTADKIYGIIKKAPTVDAVPVVHGKWTTIEDDYCGLVALECSVCNAQLWFEDDASFGMYHYCPECGSKMDGDDDD